MSEQPKQQTESLDLSSIDSSTKPQADFFAYANGKWLSSAVVPSDRTSWGSFSILEDTIDNRLHSLLDSIVAGGNEGAGTIGGQLRAFYSSAMDTTAINHGGIVPVKPELDSINSIKNPADAARVIGYLWRVNHGSFFNYYVNPDDRNSGFYIAHFEQGGLSLPNRDYYFNKDSSTVAIQIGWRNYVDTLFRLAGEEPGDAIKNAIDVYTLETRLAKVSKPPVALRDPVANYHKFSVRSLTNAQPAWQGLLQGLGIGSDSVLVAQPEFFHSMFALIATTPVSVIKNYLRAKLLQDDAAYLPGEFVRAKLHFNRVLYGTTTLKPRWKMAAGWIDASIGDALGQVYVAKYFPPESKKRIGILVNNILDTYAEKIQRLTWMTDSTRQKALDKLTRVVKKIGYPDTWRDYQPLAISKTDLVANLRNSSHLEYLRQLKKLGTKTDKTEWFMTPPTIDAYYEPGQNTINFPAGILAPPFFFADGDDAVNYGAIGYVIGHEITHGFDDEGRKYDAYGNLRDWWSKKDAEEFDKRAQHVVDQYNQFIAVDTFHLNGKLTEGENLADNGGVAIAFAAFKKTKEGSSKEKINGFTPDQRFFLSVAQVWREKYRPELIRYIVLSNPHSLPRHRVNGPVSNMPAFYTAFGVEPSDPMYRDDSVRVDVW